MELDEIDWHPSLLGTMVGMDCSSCVAFLSDVEIIGDLMVLDVKELPGEDCTSWLSKLEILSGLAEIFSLLMLLGSWVS